MMKNEDDLSLMGSLIALVVGAFMALSFTLLACGAVWVMAYLVSLLY